MPEKEPQILKGNEVLSETREAKEENQEALGLRREGEKIYSKEFVEKLNDILGHEFKVKGKDGGQEKVILKDIIDKHLERFSSPEFSILSAEERVERQREFVKDFGRGIYKIPGGDPWSFYFDRAIKIGRMNCSCCAALLGIILENTKQKTGIQNVEYGTPYGHAINMITFGDGRLYFTDARNGMFEDVSDYIKTEEKQGLKVYKIEQPKGKTGYQIIYRIIPVSPVSEGVLSSYLGNLHAAYTAAEGKFDAALKMGHSKDELAIIQKTAKMICLEKNLLSSKQARRIDRMNFFISKKNKEYEKSEEFEKERRRIEKIIGGKEHDVSPTPSRLKLKI